MDAAEGLAPAATLTLTFTTANWDALRTIRVTAIGDGVVEGQHVTLLATTVTSGDTTTGTVSGGTGRADEFTVAGSPFTAHSLRGLQVRITGGTGAGQVRTIWDNLAGTIVASEDWDVLPDATSTFVISGYTGPVTAGQLTGTVTNADTHGDGRTVTLTGVTLPTANGGLAGAILRVVGATGETFYRVIASNTATTITVVDAWGTGAITVGTQLLVTGIPGADRRRRAGARARRRHQGRGHRPDRRHHPPARRGRDRRPVRCDRELHRAPDPLPRGRRDRHVVLRPILTPSLDIGGPDCGLPSGCSRLPGRVRRRRRPVAAGRRLAAPHLHRRERGTSPQIVTIARACRTPWSTATTCRPSRTAQRRTIGIQGPLFVSGGDDPNPPVELSLDGYLPILLPGESSGGPLPITASTARRRSSPRRSTGSSCTTRTARPPTPAS